MTKTRRATRKKHKQISEADDSTRLHRGNANQEDKAETVSRQDDCLLKDTQDGEPGLRNESLGIVVKELKDTVGLLTRQVALLSEQIVKICSGYVKSMDAATQTQNETRTNRQEQTHARAVTSPSIHRDVPSEEDINVPETVNIKARSDVCSVGACGSDLQTAGYTEGMFSKSALDTPIGALKNSRRKICHMLNKEKDPVESHLPPDYRGLAELLKFDDLQIQNLYAVNPTKDLLRQWARSPKKRPFLWNLIRHLHTLRREDVLEDCCDLISEDVAAHYAEQNILNNHTVGLSEHFDCYVNIADEDLTTIGRDLIDKLEGVYRLRLCLTLRDVTLGVFELEEMANMLKTRCRGKVVIVLSRHYRYSEACRFLTQFAVTLDPGAEKGNLMPIVIDEDVDIPLVLQGRAMLNYGRDRQRGTFWPRLYGWIRSHVA